MDDGGFKLKSKIIKDEMGHIFQGCFCLVALSESVLIDSAATSSIELDMYLQDYRESAMTIIVQCV